MQPLAHVVGVIATVVEDVTILGEQEDLKDE